MKIPVCVLVFVGLTSLASAQTTAAPTSRLAWDQVAPNLITAQSYTYKAYADGATTGVVLQAVACDGAASPFICAAPFPPFTPGNHTISVSAGNQAGDTLPSMPLTFVMVLLPAAPTNLRISGGV